MDIEYGEELVLDNNKSYVCFKKANYKDEKYVFLINSKNKKDIKVARQILDSDDLSLEFIYDKELLTKLHSFINRK